MQQLEFGLLTRCDGSARATLGGTVALAGVYGPVEAKGTSGEKVDSASVEVQLKSFAPESTVTSDQDASVALRGLLQASVLTKLYPRTVISISVRVLADDGALMTAAVMAAVAALVDAGIPLANMPMAADCLVKPDGTVLVDPSRKDVAELGEQPRLTLAFSAEAPEPALVTMRGMCSEAMLGECVLAASASANQKRAFVADRIRGLVSANKDLMYA
jgi:ribonuclease PH